MIQIKGIWGEQTEEWVEDKTGWNVKKLVKTERWADLWEHLRSRCIYWSTVSQRWWGVSFDGCWWRVLWSRTLLCKSAAGPTTTLPLTLCSAAARREAGAMKRKETQWVPTRFWYDRINIYTTCWYCPIIPHCSKLMFHWTHQILKVIAKESIPAVNHPLGNSRPIEDLKQHHNEQLISFQSKLITPLCQLFWVSISFFMSLISDRYLLQDRNDWRLPLLQEVENHQDVSIGREASSGRIPNVAALWAQRDVSHTAGAKMGTLNRHSKWRVTSP